MLSPAPPQSFLDGLNRDFGGKVRLRWSPQRNRWQIERKGPPEGKVSDWRDRFDALIRVRDRVYRVMEVSPGSLVTCGYCAFDYHTPQFSKQAARCPRCDKQELVMNWPLGDRLLEELRFGDPDRDGLERMWKDTLREEEALEKGRKRDSRNYGEAVWKEEFNRVFEIQSKGYTGKEHSWVGAPESKRFGGNV
jgi:predicted Zn-ribbon and HTH transcriptional regulator